MSSQQVEPSTELAQALQDIFGREPLDENLFMAGCLSTQQAHRASRTFQLLREKKHEGFIGCGIDRRSRDLDLKFVAQDITDLVFGSARLSFDQEQGAQGVNT